MVSCSFAINYYVLLTIVCDLASVVQFFRGLTMSVTPISLDSRLILPIKCLLNIVLELIVCEEAGEIQLPVRF